MPAEFLTEKELRKVFWSFYGKRKSIKSFQFEVGIREGNTDLVTIEEYQDNLQVNSFEFKVRDFQKAFLQAKANLEYVQRSWIVMPISIAKSMSEKFQNQLNEYKEIGVMGVEPGGRYEVIHKVKRENPDVKLHSAILKIALKEI